MAGTIESISKIHRLAHSPWVTFGDVTYEPGGTLGPRVQPDFQLVIIHEGESHVSVDGIPHALPAGSATLLKPGGRESFVFSRTSRTHHTWCAVNLRVVSEETRAELQGAPFSMPLTARLETFVELGLTCPPSGSPAAGQLIDSLGGALLREYLAGAESGGGADRRTALLPNQVRRAKEWIDAHSAAPATMASLARTACCTPNHLIKLFRQHLGVTPARYLWGVRVTRGVELLRQTGLTISEIADRTGFQTAFHFSRLVKERHHLPPKQLRQQSWNPVARSE